MPVRLTHPAQADMGRDLRPQLGTSAGAHPWAEIQRRQRIRPARRPGQVDGAAGGRRAGYPGDLHHLADRQDALVHRHAPVDNPALPPAPPSRGPGLPAPGHPVDLGLVAPAKQVWKGHPRRHNSTIGERAGGPGSAGRVGGGDGRGWDNDHVTGANLLPSFAALPSHRPVGATGGVG
ncbi:hypothetical protein GCM10022379_07710 [Micromonospora maritima]